MVGRRPDGNEIEGFETEEAEERQTVLDIRILELLSARMCHDLISPVSAINNGIELVTEIEDDMRGEAMSLIGDSAQAASSLLQFYRAALGSARSADGGPLGVSEARKRALEALGGGRIEIDWADAGSAAPSFVAGRNVKLLLALVMLAHDVLPGAGQITVRLTLEGAVAAAEVSAAKEGFIVSEEFAAAIDGSVAPETLTPKTVTGAYTRLLAETLGTSLDCDMEPGHAAFRVRLSDLG